MIRVKNDYDFTVEELTDILENTPIKADLDTNAAVAEYIIQALNINRIVKKATGSFMISDKQENEATVYHRDAPYHIEIKRNKDGKQMFACNARTIAFFAYDPLLGKPHKAILAEQKPTATDIANVCELLGDVREWGTMQ